MQQQRLINNSSQLNIIVASSWLSVLFILLYIFLRLAKQSEFNHYPENVENMVSS